MAVVERALGSALDVRISQYRGGARLAGIAEHDIVAKVVAARLRQLLVDPDRLGARAGVVDTGEAPPVSFGDSRKNSLSRIGAGRGRNHAIDEAIRVIDEHSGRFARCESHDPSARGVGGRCGYVRGLHRSRVGQYRVTVDAREHDGIVGERASERVVSRKLFAGPEILVPSPSLNPDARSYILRPRFDAADRLFVRLRSRQVYSLQHFAEAEQMGMGVSESRNHGGPVKIDNQRRWAGQNFRLRIRSDEEDAASAHCQGGRARTRVVDGVDLSVGENEIGGSLRFEHCWCERGNRKVG